MADSNRRPTDAAPARSGAAAADGPPLEGRVRSVTTSPPEHKGSTPTLYLITYDLVQPGRNYQRLFDLLISWGAKRALLSTWVLKSTKSLDVGAMRDELKRFIDANDRLLVTEMGIWAACSAMTLIACASSRARDG